MGGILLARAGQGALSGGGGGATTYATEAWTGTTGAAWPASPNTWTGTQRAGTGGAPTIHANTGRISPGSTAYAYYSAYLGSMSAVGDVLVSATFVFNSQAESYYGIGVCADNATNTNNNFYGANGYYFEWYPTATAASTTLAVSKYVASAYTSLGTSTVTMTTGTVYNVKVQRVGTTIRGKFWTGTEPGTWNLSFTDSALSTGRVLLITSNGTTAAARPIDFDDLAVTSA